ncbi:Anthocyanidin 3-O-glucoside 2''-O-glucosyltransferase [Camellia lanceoleosa]|uniref:Anthocyanidin 3-O-glucoside 2''-O-glucosyltransferase n=1 Tax=Camellia lanceoleosa TaxID=1840588 RepID=A0ACC0H5W5_9ERIC|nr:Anthocyanidin 3-O-glucoside 2''-O-glucosyltransferase [Camellia lanceoleosa]
MDARLVSPVRDQIGSLIALSPATIGYTLTPKATSRRELTQEDLMQPLLVPAPFDQAQSARGSGLSLRSMLCALVTTHGSAAAVSRFKPMRRIRVRDLSKSKALIVITSNLAGSFALLFGPVIPEPPTSPLEEKWANWNLKVGVEVEKGEDGWFTRESVCRAVRVVMDEESEIGKEVRENHGKMREFLLNKDLESSYIDDFNKKLHGLLG